MTIRIRFVCCVQECLSCVQDAPLWLRPPTITAAYLPQDFRQTANLPPMMATGLRKRHKPCSRTKPGRRCITRQASTNARVSDTRPAASSLRRISCEHCCVRMAAGNGLPRSWMARTHNGGGTSSAPVSIPNCCAGSWTTSQRGNRGYFQ